MKITVLRSTIEPITWTNFLFNDARDENHPNHSFVFYTLCVDSICWGLHGSSMHWVDFLMFFNTDFESDVVLVPVVQFVWVLDRRRSRCWFIDTPSMCLVKVLERSRVVVAFACLHRLHVISVFVPHFKVNSSFVFDFLSHDMHFSIV